ncbi:MAG: hypothetical protein NT001_01620 [Candidatus Woesearchaeota archaeon]|nr:hypothetical protein [Candidatus Woesearchaeota archaeon]
MAIDDRVIANSKKNKSKPYDSKEKPIPKPDVLDEKSGEYKQAGTMPEPKPVKQAVPRPMPSDVIKRESMGTPVFQERDENGKYVWRKGETQAPYERPSSTRDIFKDAVERPIESAVKGIEKKEKLTLTQKIKGFAANLKNIPKNAVDTTVGYVDSKYLNWQTGRYLKKNPNSDSTVLYMMHGLDQSIGSQRKLARQARDQGYLPYLLSGKHSKGPEWVADDALRQVGKLHKKAHIKDASNRNDKYVGHSSGANVGLYLATDKRTEGYGIKEVHAVAPTPHGMKPHTLGQRLIGMVADLSPEDTRKEKGRQNVMKLNKRGEPYIPVYVTAGRYDNLVPPQDAVYQHAKGMHIIDHPDSTHFGTSGPNEKMNQIILDLIGHPSKYKHMREYFRQEK